MLEQADPWFLRLAVLILSGYFLWSIRKVLADFSDQVKDLKDLLGKLFEHHDNHEQRLSRLEGVCQGRRNAKDCE